MEKEHIIVKRSVEYDILAKAAANGVLIASKPGRQHSTDHLSAIGIVLQSNKLAYLIISHANIK